MRRFPDPPNYPERMERFRNALEEFSRRYKLSNLEKDTLSEALRYVPVSVEMREKRLYMGMCGDITDPPVAQYGETILSLIKSGWLKGISDTEVQNMRKRFSRTGSFSIKPRGPKKYPYEELEMTYILAIVEHIPKPAPRKVSVREEDTLSHHWYGPSFKRNSIQSTLKPAKKPRVFPFSRRASGKFSGPALELLMASLNLALPHTGVDGVPGLTKRLVAFNKASQKKLDK